MYIPPFWCGVAVTIVAEIIAFHITMFVMAFMRGGRKNERQ